jgi:hypothetical protein
MQGWILSPLFCSNHFQKSFAPKSDRLLDPVYNLGRFGMRTRGPGFSSIPPLSIAYDTEVSMCDYLGLVAFWVLGTNTGFPSDAFFGQTSA